MIEIKGEYNTAKVFTDTLESSAEGLIKALVNKKFCEGSQIRIMPDVHAGKGCVVGMTMTINDKVCPNFVGNDIGCGVSVTEITLPKKMKNIDFNKLDKVIRSIKEVPIYPSDEIAEIADFHNLYDLDIAKHVDMRRVVESIGSIGGGNHFIEIDRDFNGRFYISIHSGSRWLGNKIAEVYQAMAWDNCKDNPEVPYEFAYLTGSDIHSYIHDMEIAKEFAEYNRSYIASMIIKEMGFNYGDLCIDTPHNYISGDMVLRKGAIAAHEYEPIVIPMNMRDGILICKGKGNPDWNFSAPHGAGRLYSRKDTKEKFTLSQYKKSMDGIYSTCINRSTLDESPMAYKSMEDIMTAIESTAEIEMVIKPVYNFKES